MQSTGSRRVGVGAMGWHLACGEDGPGQVPITAQLRVPIRPWMNTGDSTAVSGETKGSTRQASPSDGKETPFGT